MIVPAFGLSASMSALGAAMQAAERSKSEFDIEQDRRKMLMREVPESERWRLLIIWEAYDKRVTSEAATQVAPKPCDREHSDGTDLIVPGLLGMAVGLSLND